MTQRLEKFVAEFAKKMVEELDQQELNDLLFNVSPSTLGTTIKKQVASELDDTQDSLLRKVALHDTNRLVRLEAISKLRDEETLENIAVTDSYSMCRLEAIKNIKSIERLKRILSNSNEHHIFLKRAAIANIDSQSELENISKSDSFDLTARCLAIAKLQGEDVIESFVISDAYDDEIKAAANSRLFELYTKEKS